MIARDMRHIEEYADERGKELARDLCQHIFNTWQRPRPPVMDEQGWLHCPGCWKLISRDHAERRPKFCEDCGQALDWGE